MRSDWPERIAGIEPEIAELRRRVAGGGRAQYELWRAAIARRRFAPSALNLAHYLELRQTDLRSLQRELMSLGLSSLGRAEGRVLATLEAVAGALALMRGTAPHAAPSRRQFFRGERLLAANASEALGAAHAGRAGRIMVTLSAEAAGDPAFVRDLVNRGADLVRINCAHDSPREWAGMIANVKRANHAMPVLMDIAGPKVRTAKVLAAGKRDRVVVGDEILIAKAIDSHLTAFPFQCTLSLPAIAPRLRAGDAVLIDDGAIVGVVARLDPRGPVLRVDACSPKGVKLKPEKGLLFPHVDLGLSPLTEKDHADLDFVASHADLVGYSFVQSAEHVTLLQHELASRRKDWARLVLVAKIETARAVANLPEIIVAAASQQPLAVMIARGDLAMELGFERLAEMQEEILWLCEAAAVPAIWATEVLGELVTTGLPSRGEMTDAAMAGRAECVMLNKGANLAAAVATLDRLLARMSEHQTKKTPTLRALTSWKLPGSRTDYRPS